MSEKKEASVTLPQREPTLRVAPTTWHLLSISFDPEHDTPEVLRQYGEKYQQDAASWTLATGALIEIDALTEQFGLTFARMGEGFDHNLRTVVVDARGRIQRILIGNEWEPDELVAEVLESRPCQVRQIVWGQVSRRALGGPGQWYVPSREAYRNP